MSLFTCIIATFSVRQRSQLRVPGLYGLACFMISYWMLGAGYSLLSQTYLDRAVVLVVGLRVSNIDI